MYLYMGLLAVIPGIIYFTFFIKPILTTILNIHTKWFQILINKKMITIQTITSIKI